MDFGQAIGSCFRKYVGFRGRAPRSEYWFFVLFAILVLIGASILDAAFVPDHEPDGPRPFTGIAWLALFLPGLAVTFRRLHDTGWSGWLVGGYYLLFVIFAVAAFNAYSHATPENAPPNSGEVLAGLMAIVLLAYLLFLFVLTVLKGHEGSNRYGPDPFAKDADVF